jgi:myo-inositol-hexaphosphate 3-phosphohydrolase
MPKPAAPPPVQPQFRRHLLSLARRASILTPARHRPVFTTEMRGDRRRTCRRAMGVLLGSALLLTSVAMPALTLAANAIVLATVETDAVHNVGDCADDEAIWIHPTDPSLSVVIGTDKCTSGGLNVYDLSGHELHFYQDARENNVDVRYNFPLGSQLVSIVGATNRLLQTIDFYRVNVSDRSLVKIGSVATSSAIKTPRGFALYHSPISGKFYAFVTDSGHSDQYELSGSTGSVTGRLVRQLIHHNPTEGLVADDELARVYVAEEDIGGVFRYGAEPGDGTTGDWILKTTENGGPIQQDVKGLSMYYAANGRGYLIAASQGGSSFGVLDRQTNAWLGAFQIALGNGIDKVTGEDGIDVTNFNLGSRFPSGFFASTDYDNSPDNQNHKLVPWQAIANAFSPELIIDSTFDPRLIGAPGGTGPVTTISSGPTGTVNTTDASFLFASSASGSTFACSLDAASFTACSSPKSYSGLSEGSHTFQVRATDSAGNVGAPASLTWTIDVTAPTVTATTPTAGATDVSTAITVRATFSEPMSASTITASTLLLRRTSDSSPVSGTVNYDAGTRTASLAPSSTLAAGVGYTATVVGGSSGVKDLAGNAVSSSVAWSFTTATSSPPPPPPPPPSGSITRESISTVVNSTATNVITIPRPSGVTAGDVLVSCLTSNGGSVTSSGLPAGWTAIASVTAISNPHVFGYYHVATASEPASYSWTLNASVVNSAGIARYSGVNASQPLDGSPVTATGAAATTATLAGVTTGTANDMLVGCLGANTSSATIILTSPSGMTAAWDLGGKRQQLADQTLPAAGATGSRTWTLSSAREWAGWLVALRAS